MVAAAFVAGCLDDSREFALARLGKLVCGIGPGEAGYLSASRSGTGRLRFVRCCVMFGEESSVVIYEKLFHPAWYDFSRYVPIGIWSVILFQVHQYISVRMRVFL